MSAKEKHYPEIENQSNPLDSKKIDIFQFLLNTNNMLTNGISISTTDFLETGRILGETYAEMLLDLDVIDKKKTFFVSDFLKEENIKDEFLLELGDEIDKAMEEVYANRVNLIDPNIRNINGRITKTIRLPYTKD